MDWIKQQTQVTSTTVTTQCQFVHVQHCDLARTTTLRHGLLLKPLRQLIALYAAGLNAEGRSALRCTVRQGTKTAALNWAIKLNFVFYSKCFEVPKF